MSNITTRMNFLEVNTAEGMFSININFIESFRPEPCGTRTRILINSGIENEFIVLEPYNRIAEIILRQQQRIKEAK